MSKNRKLKFGSGRTPGDAAAGNDSEQESRGSSGRLRSANEADRRAYRTWPYVFWTVVSLLVLVLVVNYDRRSAAEGLMHLEEGRRLTNAGRIDDAAAEFRLALRNQRLSNNFRAEAAVLLAELEHKERGNTSAALELLQEARRLSFRASDRLDVPGKIKELQERPHSVGRHSGALISLAPTSEETSGPVLAALTSGKPVYLGSLVERLRASGQMYNPDFRKAPDLLEGQLVGLIQDEEYLERAIQAGVHQSPEFQRELWNVARGLLVTKAREMAIAKPSDAEVEQAAKAIYEERKGQYQRPATVNVFAVIADTKERAEEARQALISGAAFEQVVTSYSVEKVTASRGGFLGDIRGDQSDFAGLGHQPQLGKKLHEVPIGSITLPAQIGDKWVIFQVRRRQEGVLVTYDEVRSRLMGEVLAGKRAKSARPTLEQVSANVDMKLLRSFWDIADGNSTGTKVLKTAEGQIRP